MNIDNNNNNTNANTNDNTRNDNNNDNNDNDNNDNDNTTCEVPAQVRRAVPARGPRLGAPVQDSGIYTCIHI